ncbi:hypothetical protein I308_106258 [Cryptococcus tetragattii IND107]|uniref:Uncharacterized protein n=1 Tax=Cryptococcus tetragattii IND107 TaxID=1296105 RepID=A0ABR3BJU7_9TREE|nr:hypothetical protein I308_06838 [Cryptococcus tetragattii IND107]
MATVMYLTDAYEKYASSALSAASLGRNTFAAFLPLASQNLFNNLGFHWAGSLLGFLALVLSGVPILLFFKGRYLRSKSPFIAEATFDQGDSEERHKTNKVEKNKGLGGPAGQAKPTAPTIGR